MTFSYANDENSDFPSKRELLANWKNVREFLTKVVFMKE
jgi:hypothetical protein